MSGRLAYSFNLMSNLKQKIGRLLAACLAVTGLLASEHHGIVKSGGMPIPGATVTATQGDKKVVTTTDEQGAYSLNLEDGVWKIQVEMLGFAKTSNEIGVAATAPSPTWDLKLLSASELKAALNPPAETAAAKPAEAPKEAPKPAAPTATAAAPASQRPSIRAANAQNGARGGRGNFGGRGQNGQNGQGNGFQRVDMNASDTTGQAGSDNMGFDNNSLSADTTQSANDALAIGGSVSTGLGLPQENDWGGRGPGGFGGPGMFGMMGGPGGPGGMGVDGQQPGGDMAGGPGGGRGGPGGPGGGRGGPGGGGPMMMGGGGPGGFGGGRGGFGGPGGGRGFGGRDGGRGGRGPGGRTANAFGNGRRNPRSRYNGNLAIIESNSALDARQYSLTGQDTAKPSTQNARVTAMFGGPLKIPHLLSGDKTFFTINYQFARARTGNTITTLMPTADERAGDFSQAFNQQGQPVTVYDPKTGNPFPGNIIPASRIDPIAQGLLSFYPLPNFTNNLRYNYQAPIVGANNQDNINTRISETVNAKNQISGNFSFQRANGTNVNVFNFNTASHQSAYNTGLSWTYHITPRLMNSASFNFSRNSMTNDPYFANRVNVSGQLGITGNDQDPNFWGPPTLGFANGFAGLSDGNKTLNRAQTAAFNDSIRWFHGTHNFTFGGDFRRVQNNPLSQQNPRGTFQFTGSNTALNGVGGFDFADFLLGVPDTSQIAFGNADKYFRASWMSAYFTDDWRISTKLSLNAGFRWDYQTPTTELYGRLVNLNIGPGFTTASTVCATTVAGCTPASQVGYPDGLVHSNPREFQPRVGAAWRPLTKGSLVIRGGYGIYYNTSVYQSLVSQMAQQSPLSYSLIDSYTAATPLTLANGFPVQTLSPITTFAVDPNFRIGYAQSWQMSVQQNLPGSLVATATYSGAKGTHQAQEFIPNSTPPKSAAVCTTCPTNFYYMTSGGNTISNNLWLQLNRRFHNGFMGNLMYMHANSIDNAMSGGGGRGGGGQGASMVAQNWQDLSAERARTSGIRSNTLNAMMQFSTGMGSRGGALLNGFKGKLLRDWTIMTNFSIASGAPETPSVVNAALGRTGIVGPLRAFYTGAPAYLGDGSLNPAAFISPVGFWGNAGRNILTGPTTFSMNASFSRTIRLGERRSADFRIEARNPLNHPSFGSYNTQVGSTQFGLLQGPSPMRSLTANLRFRF